ncbi:methionine ABC transporter ATP-binding protein [[Clostridium] scindens]|uniref:methionine ABC transporter ATP-binding protein n=1 Tax=Clostridium scindens (strain JCM 10418 / VPI 12708) TaxID=29347 RepID=UPI0026770E3E|nr:methionine ABC transporter ATP-binding protein [[Clostridium] scindens]
MISIEKLTKKYGTQVVLDNINIQIQDGEIFGLIGRSGVGKSTLLRCINGLESFDSGSLIVDGTNVKELNKKTLREFRKSVGMVFQHFSLLKRLTVYENVALPLKTWGYSKEETAKIVNDLLEIVGLSEKSGSYPDELSGGQKQRVAIARALTLNPKILLCDEATSALDPQTAKSVIKLLVDINQRLGITIIVVTHQMSVVKSCCERIAILEEGKVAVEGNVEEIFIEQSKPLQRLIGQKDLALPPEGENIKILLSNKNSKEPVISTLSRELNIDVRVLGGEMEYFREHTVGTLIMNVESSNMQQVTAYLEERGIKWFLLSTEDENTKEGVPC